MSLKIKPITETRWVPNPDHRWWIMPIYIRVEWVVGYLYSLDGGLTYSPEMPGVLP